MLLILVSVSISVSFVAAADCECGCVESTIVSTVTGPPPVSVAAPSNANKTATKVANSGGHANTQAPAKRSSSGADGDYALVQHEVLYSLSAQYEVSRICRCRRYVG